MRLHVLLLLSLVFTERFVVVAAAAVLAFQIRYNLVRRLCNCFVGILTATLALLFVYVAAATLAYACVAHLIVTIAAVHLLTLVSSQSVNANRRHMCIKSNILWL